MPLSLSPNTGKVPSASYGSIIKYKEKYILKSKNVVTKIFMLIQEAKYDFFRMLVQNSYVTSAKSSEVLLFNYSFHAI